MANRDMKYINYDINKYNFAGIIKGWFGVEDLSNIHLGNTYALFSREKDQSTHWHQKYYEKIREDESFFILYRSFLENIIKPGYRENIICQRIPTFRIHLPNNIAVGEWHKDKDYRDSDWAEQVKETNYYLPLTATNTQNTVWAESEEDKRDYKPILANYGECVEWDASNLTHGNKKNISNQTRISVDFRVISESRYVDSDRRTINTDMEFKVGGYYVQI